MISTLESRYLGDPIPWPPDSLFTRVLPWTDLYQCCYLCINLTSLSRGGYNRVVTGRGHLTWIPGSQHSCHTSWDRSFLSLRELSPQALILSRRARFIAKRLKHPFLGECRRGSRHFWNHWVCMGYGHASGSYKKGHVSYSRVRGALNKYQEDMKR